MNEINQSQSGIKLSGLNYFSGSAIVIGYVALTLGVTIYSMRGIMPADSYGYLDFAAQVSEHGWQAALQQMPRLGNFPPLLTILMVAIHRTGIPLETAGRALNICACLLAAWGVWNCCWQLYRKPLTALGVALLVCSLPGWYEYSRGILRDPLYWTIVSWSCWLWLLIGRRQESWGEQCLLLLGIGLLAGLGFWCRKEMLIFVSLEVAMLLIWRFITIVKTPLRLRGRECLKTLLLLVLMLLPAGILLGGLAVGNYGYTPWNMVGEMLDDADHD